MGKNTFIILIFGLVLFTMICVTSCRKVSFVPEQDVSLLFSGDSILFDTVFTGFGSATRYFKIFNPHDDFIKINELSLEKKSGTQFQLNVDGDAGLQFSDLEIAPKDSMYVFVNVTVNPDLPPSLSPYVISDYIHIKAGNKSYKVLLEAWGQNANYIPGREDRKGIALLSCDFGTVSFDDPKPYVIHGVLLVDSCTLYIPAGQRVYIYGGIAQIDGSFYGNGQLHMLKDGKLITDGTPENRVIIEGTRLEPEYRDDWGQWERIQFTAGSTGNRLKYTDIREGNIGIYVDSLAEVRMEGVGIYNNSTYNILTKNGTIYAENSLFHSSGNHNININLGGNYEFNYCTFANHRLGRQVISASSYLRYDDVFIDNDLYLTMRNSIVYSSNPHAILIPQGNDLNYLHFNFDHVAYRIDTTQLPSEYTQLIRSFTNNFELKGTDTLFLYPDSLDFRLDTTSVARDKGTPVMGITTDKLGKLRDFSTPDLGCYEFTE